MSALSGALATSHQPPAPEIGGQFLQGLVGKDAPIAAGRELAALVIEPVESLDHVRALPGLVRADQRRREAHGVEWDVVLAEELDVADVIGLPPPCSPVAARRGGGPFLGGGDVTDRRVEPDIEDLVGESLSRNRDAPGQIARDAAIAQIGCQPAFRGRYHEGGPAGAAIDPRAQRSDKLRLAQEQMAAFSDLQRPVARQRRSRVDQFGRIEQRATLVTLITARGRVAAMRAGAEHVAVRQEAAVRG